MDALRIKLVNLYEVLSIILGTYFILIFDLAQAGLKIFLPQSPSARITGTSTMPGSGLSINK
jgi:hypothetical protein